jgi:putative toxin-antitoxin system antitoxin component (TIGR02293 family)
MAKSSTVKRNNTRTRAGSDEDRLFKIFTMSGMGALNLSSAVKRGLKYSFFRKLAHEIPFSSGDWSAILHLSERTMQRYKNENKTFDPIYSDKILQIAVLYKMGNDVFGDKGNFNTWLETKSLALGGAKPKELLDNTFGIDIVKDELSRIENGVLA